jgi:putative ABC transport system permease protein
LVLNKGHSESHFPRRISFGRQRNIRGCGAAIVLSRVLRTFLFEVQPNDPMTLIVVGAVFAGVALPACWVPVRRAANVDPLEALRYE